jgi:hypothetical protein
MDSGVDERRQRAFVFGAVLGIGAAALARRRSGAVAEAIAVMPVTGLAASAASPPVNMSPSPYSLEPSWLLRRRGRCQAMAIVPSSRGKAAI